jgi:hypothetical protein
MEVEENPHNYRKVGYGMILVAASLTTIALLGIVIGEDVLYGDKIQRAKLVDFEKCREADFQLQECSAYWEKLNNDVAGIYTEQP